jgi:hypothetical protein
VVLRGGWRIRVEEQEQKNSSWKEAAGRQVNMRSVGLHLNTLCRLRKDVMVCWRLVEKPEAYGPHLAP